MDVNTYCSLEEYDSKRKRKNKVITTSRETIREMLKGKEKLKNQKSGNMLDLRKVPKEIERHDLKNRWKD